MNRKAFIERSLLGMTGILVSNVLIRCSNQHLKLDQIIGESEDLLEKFSGEGNFGFKYYTISKADFKSSYNRGEQVVIYCKERKIVGYTLQIEGNNEVESFLSEIEKIYNGKENLYENDFGKAFKWETKDRKITLSYANTSDKIPQYTFYSESVLDNDLIVF